MLPSSRRIRWLCLAAVAALAIVGCGGGTKVTTTKTGSNAGSNIVEQSPSEQRARAAELQVQLGQGYMQRGQYEIAETKLKKAIEEDGSSYAAYTLLGLLNEQIGRSELAAKHYAKAVQIAPERGDVNNNYGQFLCGQRRFPEAQQHFNRALADPYYATPGVAHANAGACALSANQTAQAEQHFRKALALNAAEPVALYSLARLYHERGDNLKARAFIQRYDAAAKSPTGASLDLAARIETALGDREAAHRLNERMAREFPEYRTGTGQPATDG